MAKIKKIQRTVDGVLTTEYPVTIHQAVVDVETDETLNVTLSNIKNDITNKANHGYDSSPKTLKEVDDAKVDKSSIKQVNGSSEVDVMSQKAVTDELAAKAAHGYSEEEPKTLKEIDDEKADHGYTSLAVAKTLKQVEDDTINTTEKPTAQSLSELNARITALEAILSNKIKDRVDVTKEFNVWGKTNLILYGDGASTKTPDFIGQTYIDTTNSNVYIAVGVSNAGNWKLV
jgi:hypothetical protein